MALSPMMKQYFSIKDKYPDTLLFYRLGDFYELFFDDAIKASKILDLFLTGRDCGLEERAPMCGVPFHAVDSYVAKLIDAGEKVAICEQMSLPEKGIAPREVVRVITPGTIMESSMLSPDKNNYLLSAFMNEDGVGVVWTDISTGELNSKTITGQLGLQLNDLLLKVNPSEIICNSLMKEKSLALSCVKYGSVCSFNALDDDYFIEEEAKKMIEGMCSDTSSLFSEGAQTLIACGALLKYLLQTQKKELKYIRQTDEDDDCMILDANAAKALEILSSTDGKKSGSLYHILNKTQTGMGARLLGKWLSSPSVNEAVINDRLDAVEEIVSNAQLRYEIRSLLSGISDMERLAARLAYGNINPKELLLLASSASKVPELKRILGSLKSQLLTALSAKMSGLESVTRLIFSAISENTPTLVRDGGVINDGYNENLDGFRSISRDTKSILAKLEAEEKEKTGIKNLRVGYNSVFGYYIEVSKGQVGLVPDNYVRKQTTTNAERYITDELKQLETKILHAEENALSLEQELYADLISEVGLSADNILKTSANIAQIDVIFSFAEVSVKNKYVRPSISSRINELQIKEGRHPIVESIGKEPFVPNNTTINDTDGRIMVITGPNMAGKSVYMRQVALITIMAHIGCYVPADAASIPIIDKIFTRIGASDDLHTGRSTFMVEMSEVSYILQNISDNSLVILDEVGRGTATYDGLSIAWAIMEYLSKNTKSRILFSTHYHELTELEGKLPGVKNYKMTVREIGNNIVFVRKLMRGSANKSFGIEVAGLAGLPNDIVESAKMHLDRLEITSLAKQSERNPMQMSIFNTKDNSKEILNILNDIKLDDITPRMAYEILSDLVEKANGE